MNPLRDGATGGEQWQGAPNEIQDAQAGNDNNPSNAVCKTAAYDCMSNVRLRTDPRGPTEFDSKACQVAENLCNQSVNNRIPDAIVFTKFPDGTVVVVPAQPWRSPYIVPS